MTRKKVVLNFLSKHHFKNKKNYSIRCSRKVIKINIKFSKYLTQNLLHSPFFMPWVSNVWVFLKKYLMALQSVLRNSVQNSWFPHPLSIVYFIQKRKILKPNNYNSDKDLFYCVFHIERNKDFWWKKFITKTIYKLNNNKLNQ